MPDRILQITQATGGGFRVAPFPPLPERPDLQGYFSCPKAARRFADAIRIVKGWKVQDNSGKGGEGG